MQDTELRGPRPERHHQAARLEAGQRQQQQHGAPHDTYQTPFRQPYRPSLRYSARGIFGMKGTKSGDLRARACRRART
eukprot:4378265-Pyramimonas_sp.AAC.1